MSEARRDLLFHVAKERYPEGVIIQDGQQYLCFRRRKNGRYSAIHPALSKLFLGHYPLVQAEQLVAEYDNAPTP